MLVSLIDIEYAYQGIDNCMNKISVKVRMSVLKTNEISGNTHIAFSKYL